MDVDLQGLRRVLLAFLDSRWPDAQIELEVCLLGSEEMTQVNEAFLGHKRPTDVITFDYAAERDKRTMSETCSLKGEIFVCLDEALAQSRRFHATWQSEMVRYIIHGVLHLSGYDDRRSRDRRRMKSAENYWVRKLASQFAFEQLGKARPGKT